MFGVTGTKLIILSLHVHVQAHMECVTVDVILQI